MFLLQLSCHKPNNPDSIYAVLIPTQSMLPSTMMTTHIPASAFDATFVAALSNIGFPNLSKISLASLVDEALVPDLQILSIIDPTSVKRSLTLNHDVICSLSLSTYLTDGTTLPTFLMPKIYTSRQTSKLYSSIVLLQKGKQ